jgi:hypothetical protein
VSLPEVLLRNPVAFGKLTVAATAAVLMRNSRREPCMGFFYANDKELENGTG